MRKDCIPDQPWRNIRGLGNWLRHQYDSVDREIIWNTIHEDLPKLKNAVFQAIDNRRPKMHPEAEAPE
jgi:uncharacterized protein with HEPN domain